MNEQVETLAQVKRTAVDLAIRFGPKLLVAILILFVGVAVSRWVSRWLVRGLRRIELEPPVRALLGRIAWIAVFALFAIMALQNLGVELLPLLAGLGVAGAGIALATQGVLSNLVAGLSIIFTKPYRVGEYISIVGVEGTVESITLFSTTLGHNDRSRIVVPNRKIAGEILHNYGRIRQLDVLVGVGYETDIQVALSSIHEILSGNARVLREPAPVIQTTQLGDSAISIAVRPWVGVIDQGAATSEINNALLATFRERGISIPAPQREVRFIGTEGLRIDSRDPQRQG